MGTRFISLIASAAILVTAASAEAARPRRPVVERLAREAGLGLHFDIVGRPLGFGPNRWVVVLAVSLDQGPLPIESEFSLHAIAIDTPPEGEPRLRGHVELPTAPFLSALDRRGRLVFETVEPPHVLASRLDDFDADGERELELVVGHNGPPVCPVGTTAYREYYVLDPSDGLRLAATVRTNELPEADSSPHIYGTILHEDVDHDGHPDSRLPKPRVRQRIRLGAKRTRGRLPARAHRLPLGRRPRRLDRDPRLRAGRPLRRLS